MSDAGAANLLTTAVFNPALLRKEDLVRGFVVRQELLHRLLDDLRRAQPGSPPQHQIIIGQRGLGKTTLLRRVAFAIEDDPALSAKWLPLVFPEEQYNIKNLGDFWLNCVDALSDVLDRTGHEAASETLDEKVAKVSADPKQRSGDALALLLSEAERIARGLVLLVDNLDIVLERLDEREEWEFRRVISQDHRLYFLGASSKALEALYDHGRAFYDYFQVHDLKGLSETEMFALLRRLAEEAGDERVLRMLKENPARVRALRVLTGGNPRTVVLLYRILSQGPDGDAQRDIEQLLDLYTPLYKSRFEELSPQSQQIMDAMAIHWDPITAGDLAEQLAPLSVNQVSSLLKRLEDQGLVEKAPWFGERKAAFQIAERFFNIWYLMRASRRVRRRLIWLVKFLQTWFEQDELKERAQTYLLADPNLVGRERYAEMALAYAQVVQDKYLRHSLESAALQAALEVSAICQFDFSDLSPELLDRKARMEKMRQLRNHVLSLDLEGINSSEFWLLLAGSPLLLAEQKMKLRDDLASFTAPGLKKIFAALESSRTQLSNEFGSDAVAPLYQALASGEVADAFDLDGSLALARQKNCGVIPLAAIAGRIRALGSLAFRETEKIENLLQRLGVDQTYQPNLSRLWFRLGEYYRSIQSIPEAERTYRKALEIDPRNEDALFFLAAILAGRGLWESAEEVCRNVININPENAVTWCLLGVILTHSDHSNEAEEALRKATEIDGQNPAAWMLLGSRLDNLGREGEAEVALRRVIELDPNEHTAWLALATLLARHTGRESEALRAFQRAIELEPNIALPRTETLRVSRTLAKGPDSSGALGLIAHLNQTTPDNEAEFTLAGMLTFNGEWAKAKIILDRLTASELVEPDIWTFSALVTTGHVGDAIEILESNGAHERWRPLYEALLAVREGAPDYLRRVAPEVRSVAEEILSQIAPEMGKRQTKYRS